jgi:flagellar M-ring protein FliF
VLSEELKEDALGIGMTSGQMRYRQGLEDYFSRKVETMLGAVLGPGNAVVRVSVDVNTSSSTTTEELYDPDVQVLRSSTVTEDVNASTETRSAGAVGVTSNSPQGNTGGGEPPVANTQQSRKSKTEQYEIGRSMTNTVRNAGDIERMTAAVFVAMRTTGEGAERQPQPRSSEEIESLRQMVVNSLGVVPERGQNIDEIVTIQEVDFAADDLAVQTAGIEPDVQINTWIDLGQKVAMVTFGLVAFLYFIRVLKRSQAEAVSLEMLGSRERGAGGRELESQVTPEMLNELIARKPDNVGQTLKQWMSAEQK